MQDTIAKEVQEALTVNPKDINFEELQREDSSPLNQPVIKKEVTAETPVDTNESKNWNVWKPEKESKTKDEIEVKQETDFRSAAEASLEQEKAEEPLDAPEQKINNDDFENNNDEPITDDDFQVPLAQANQAADAILGMTNNLLAVGGGFFVKISKHKEFYEFEEIIKVIDDQNEKNVERIKLDKEDMGLLRPLLAQVLRKKAKKLTPEQQLAGAIVSIILKKGQVVMEVRSENNLLEQRILDIVREERQFTSREDADENEFEETQIDDDDEDQIESHQSKDDKSIIEDAEVIEMEDTISDYPIMEVADESKTESND